MKKEEKKTKGKTFSEKLTNFFGVTVKFQEGLNDDDTEEKQGSNAQEEENLLLQKASREAESGLEKRPVSADASNSIPVDGVEIITDINELLVSEGATREEKKGSGEALELDAFTEKPKEPSRHEGMVNRLQGTLDHSESNGDIYNHFSIGEKKMGKMEDAMGKLREIEGFLAVGLFSPEGEMIGQVSNSDMKMADLGALANDVLLKAQKATDIMGVGRGQVVHIDAPKAHVVARCLNESTDFAAQTEGRAHLHMVLVVAKEGNLAMAKIRLNSVIQELAPAFR